MDFEVATVISNKSQFLLRLIIMYRSDATIGECWFQEQKESMKEGHNDSEQSDLGKEEEERRRRDGQHDIEMEKTD